MPRFQIRTVPQSPMLVYVVDTKQNDAEVFRWFKHRDHDKNKQVCEMVATFLNDLDESGLAGLL